MNNTGFYYAVTRVHYAERNLLNDEDITKLREAQSLAEGFELLKSKGWGEGVSDSLDIGSLLSSESNKVWAFVEELVGKVEAFDIFRIKPDYNNLKAAIKLNYVGEYVGDTDKYFMPYSSIPKATLIESSKSGDFSSLPKHMVKVAQSASKALRNTGSGQVCDIIIDSACLDQLCRRADETKVSFFKQYTTLTTDIANIKIAVRSSMMNRPKEFYDAALASRGSLNKEELKQSALTGLESIYNYLLTTDYADAVPEIEQSVSSLERWGDDKIMRYLRRFKTVNEGIEPIAAFIIARETEIKMVKLIFSAKMNNLSSEKVKQRTRELYV